MSEMMERTPAVIAGEINYIKRQAQRVLLGASVEIGRRLNEAKALVPHGAWEEWLSENVDYSQSTANNFMRIATEFGDEQIDLFSGKSNSETFACLTYSQAVALFALPAEERADFVETHDLSEMSIRELKDALAAEKEKNEKSAETIARMEEEAIEAERDYSDAAERLEVKEKQLQDAIKGKRDAETMLEAAKKLSDANDREKKKAIKEKVDAEQANAELRAQLDSATEQIRSLEAAAQDQKEPEKLTIEATVSQEALEAQREKIAEEERERLSAEIRAEYEKKLAAAANPDAQRAAMHMESMINSYNAFKNALQRLPEDIRERVADKARGAIEKMAEGLRDE